MRQRKPNSHLSDGRGEKSAGRLRLDLLRTFRLRRGDQPVAGFEHARLQHLLAYLALHRAAPISRRQLAFLFWPDSTDQQALKNLRTLLTRLRLALPGADQFIDITDQTVQWRLDAPFALDVAEFETAAGQGAAAQEAGDCAGAVNALAAAIVVYTGELLPDCYDDWILPLRDRLHQAYGDALERLVLLLEERREYGSALPYAQRLLNHDPLREAAYHHLIRLHLAQGRTDEARSVYEEVLAQISGVAGERLAGEDTRFETQALGNRLRHALGQSTGAEAAAGLGDLLLSENAPPRQAALYYELWRPPPTSVLRPLRGAAPAQRSRRRGRLKRL